MKISGGQQEEGVFVGNAYDKYESRNPIVKWIMTGFGHSLKGLVDIAQPTSIHEVGCGEGFWTLSWVEQGIAARGTDFSQQVIEIARDNAAQMNLPQEVFDVRSIYDVRPEADSAELIVCCEVLEHLEDPKRALAALQGITQRYLIVSVPREPLWCMLNLARGKYLRSWGNTPGHIQHWSRNGLIALVERYFDVLEVRSPIPWTMVLCRAKAGG